MVLFQFCDRHAWRATPLALALLLGACGGGSSDAGAPPPVAAPPVVAPPVVAPPVVVVPPVVPEPVVVAPTISTQPASQSVALGAPASFSVAAGGTGSLSYQWSRNGVPISGATGSSYTVAAATAQDSGSAIRVKVSSAAGSVDSAAVLLTISSPGAYVFAGVPDPGSAASAEQRYRNGTGAEARFAAPRAIALDADGNLYVADTGNNAVRKISPDGAVSTMARVSAASVALTAPRGIAAARNGSVYAIVGGPDQVVGVAPNGGLSAIVLPVPESIGYDQLFTINHVAYAHTDKNGVYHDLLVTRDGNSCSTPSSCLQYYRYSLRKRLPDGTTTLVEPKFWPLVDPSDYEETRNVPLGGMAVDSDGNTYVSYARTGAIWKVSASGVASVFVEGGVLSRPRALAFDNADNLYIVNGSIDALSVYKRSSSGTLSKVADAAQANWQAPAPLMSDDSINPAIAVGPSGTLYLTWGDAIIRVNQ